MLIHRRKFLTYPDKIPTYYNITVYVIINYSDNVNLHIAIRNKYNTRIVRFSSIHINSIGPFFDFAEYVHPHVSPLFIMDQLSCAGPKLGKAC